jgi:hypothetical protein
MRLLVSTALVSSFGAMMGLIGADAKPTGLFLGYCLRQSLRHHCSRFKSKRAIVPPLAC